MNSIKNINTLGEKEFLELVENKSFLQLVAICLEELIDNSEQISLDDLKVMVLNNFVKEFEEKYHFSYALGIYLTTDEDLGQIYRRMLGGEK